MSIINPPDWEVCLVIGNNILAIMKITDNLWEVFGDGVINKDYVHGVVY